MKLCAIALLAMCPSFSAAAEATGIVTLYALDPLASTFSFGDGQYGHTFSGNLTKNRSSDIDFGLYKLDQFSVGIEGGRSGAIVDLGTAQELKARYGYAETVGDPQGFSSLRVVDGQLVILRDYKANTTQPLREGAALLETAKPGHAAIVKGHIYLVRLVDQFDRTFERIAKLLVLDYQPGASVTLRWQTLK
jgi:hypothetical protein